MSLDILLGLQWGDEGKGKIVDLLAPRYQIVARFQGGPNAGHTLYVNGKKHVLHTIPSGIVHEGVVNVIGGGMVVDPIVLKEEIEALQQDGLFHKDRLLIAKNAHLILPTHRALDKAQEQAKDHRRIGSTQKGIGPCYGDKAGRMGIRVQDVFESDFEQRYHSLAAAHIEQLPQELKPGETEQAAWWEAIAFLKSLCVENTERYLQHHLSQGVDVMAEGAQGTLLDLDYGSYPYVTSSNTLAANACLGLGVSPRFVKDVYGVFKAYMTRVGAGPFPTELEGEDGEALQALGSEFGATTGRVRRCGWLDIPALKYAIQLNGVNRLIVTKADVLAQIDDPKFCHHFLENNGNVIEYPAVLSATCPQPNYAPFQHKPTQALKVDASLQGKESPVIQGWHSFKMELEEYTEVPIQIVSTGPERTHYLEYS